MVETEKVEVKAKAVGVATVAVKEGAAEAAEAAREAEKELSARDSTRYTVQTNVIGLKSSAGWKIRSCVSDIQWAPANENTYSAHLK